MINTSAAVFAQMSQVATNLTGAPQLTQTLQAASTLASAGQLNLPQVPNLTNLTNLASLPSVPGISNLTNLASLPSVPGIPNPNQLLSSAASLGLPNVNLNTLVPTTPPTIDSLFQAGGKAVVSARQFAAAKLATAEATAKNVAAAADKFKAQIESTLSAGSTGIVDNIAGVGKSLVNGTVTTFTAGAGAVNKLVQGGVDSAVSAAKNIASGAIPNIQGLNPATVAGTLTNPAAALGQLSTAANFSLTGPPIPSPAVLASLEKQGASLFAAAQNPPNPFAEVGAKIGQVPRPQEANFKRLLPAKITVPDFGVPTATSLAGSEIESSLYSKTKDQDLVYNGPDPIIWDRINAERLRRGLQGLPNPRPLDPDAPQQQPLLTA